MVRAVNYITIFIPTIANTYCKLV